jgi:hypothetical protein
MEAISNQGVKYAVDLVMCIDATGSMSPLINEVKSVALSFYDKLEKKMEARQKKIDQLRARVIVFRDYYHDPANMAMICSDFFDLRTEASGFANFVSRIEAAGGGDEPENALEALALALNSQWEKTQDFQRQRYVIVVWTDASAHQLEKQPKPSYYPQDIPKTFDDLTDSWDEISISAKRLLLFAPDTYPWSIFQSWDNTIHAPSSAGKGLEELDIGEILEVIANSV